MILSRRDRRALVIGGAVLVPALAFALVIAPAVRAFASLRDTLTTERALLDRERELIARPADAAALAAADARLAASVRDLLDAAEPELATAEVARSAQLIAELSGVPAVRAESHGIEAGADGWTRLRARLSGEATFAQLMLLLHRLEHDPTLLRIEQVAIRGVRAPGAVGPDDVGDARVAFTLVVQAVGAPDRARVIARAGNDQDAQPAAALRRMSNGATEGSVIASLVDDPFTPGLNPPGRSIAGEPVPTAPAGDVPALAIMGTVVLPDDRGLVMARVGAEPPRLMRVGDRIGGMRLRRVERGSAEFEDESGSKLTLRVPKPGV